MSTMVQTSTNGLAQGWLTTKDAAELLKVSPLALRMWLYRNREKVNYRFVGRSCLVEIDSLRKVYNPRV